MINRIENWIDETNREYQSQRYSCSTFEASFSGFYPPHFLRGSYFVVVEDIPKPNFPELRQMGLGDFIDMPVNGITYKNTYYVVPKQASTLRLHFHELVHVVQWSILGAEGFISRYINEIQSFGYNSAPLEKMAYFLDDHYHSGGSPLDVPSYVESKM
ncbi:hypothetical protein [Vreelandella arcis]|uniref:DUF4157 domain-containing protein n=1 Tax=Vreelandella arcis TaxID=416873 RepID=A0A1H0F1Z9_9GAMM|nr:hypothetical protein [Halomonas arcis]SDN88593.1 hypothetical protein SAMN04487951_10985 [Halomonas arcis]